MDIKITVGNKQVETTMLSVREYLSIVNDADEMIPHCGLDGCSDA